MAPRFSHLTFSEAVTEFQFEMEAIGRSPHTIRDYTIAYNYWLDVIGDQPLASIKRADVVRFLHKMAQDRTPLPGCAPRPGRKRSKKTLRNYHTALSSLWTWAVSEGYAEEHVVRAVPRPKANDKPLEPYTAEELVALANACYESRPWHNKPLTTTEKATATRDYAMICLLAETGLRNSELRDIRMDDVDWRNGSITVRHGKGDKARIVHFGNTARKALRKWLVDRPEEASRQGDHLFCNVIRYKGHPLSRNNLNKLLQRIGERAGVSGVQTHRFRHTAAIMRLRNGMNAFQLKQFLGHSDMATTLRYVQAANLDMKEATRRTSPLDNLRL